MTYDEFLSLITHELRGPIGAIGAAAQVLRGPRHGSGVADEACGIVERQARRLAEVANDIQVLGRLVSSHAQVRREAMDLLPLLRANFDCHVEAGVDVLMVETDRGAIEDALSRVVAEAPGRIEARVARGEEKTAARFSLEPVGGGFGIQILRALAEIGGAQVTFEQGAQGRRLTARLAR